MLRTHPLEAWSDAFARLPDSVGITVEPFVAMVDVRLGAVDPEASERLGVDLPTVPNTWVPTDAGRAVWLGPDEWLLTSTAETPEELEARVRAAVVPLGGSAADVSAQRITVRLHGRRGSATSSPRAARSTCTRGSSAGAGARRPRSAWPVSCCWPSSDAGDDYLVLVRSSFAGYLADWLLDAALEFTVSLS